MAEQDLIAAAAALLDLCRAKAADASRRRNPAPAACWRRP